MTRIMKRRVVVFSLHLFPKLTEVAERDLYADRLDIVTKDSVADI